MDGMQIIGILAIFGLVWIVAVYQLSPIIWTILIAVALAALSVLNWLPELAKDLFWLIFIAAAVFANARSLRITYLLPSVLQVLKKKLPPISATEKEAIEAGHTWWEKELFCGRPQWDHLFKLPAPVLTQEEQQFLDQQVETLCGMLNDWEIVHDRCDLPQNVWDYLKKEKFFGLCIPKEYGGLGFSAIAHSTVVTKIATRSMSTAVNTMVPNSLGPAELIMQYGTAEQKKHYLPRLAIGEEVPCFALTAPEAGSDAGAIPDKGVVCKQLVNGKETLGIRLSWDKRYITLAPVATVLGLAIRLFDPDHLLGNKKEIGITLCLIPTNHSGVEIGNRHLPLLLAFMNGPTRGKDVFIPLDWIIGSASEAGKGWHMLMECLSTGRAISLPALSSACAKLTYRYTGAYARIRRQFNVSISSFEGIEEALGYIAGYAYMMEACRHLTAGAVDLNIKPAIASAIAKYHMTEMARKVVSHAMDVHAGHMIQTGPRNFLAYIHISIPVSITVEGANIMTRNLIIFGQGAIRCHPYLLQEINVLSAAQPDLAALDKLLLAHIGYMMRNVMTTLGNGLSAGILIRSKISNKRIRRLHKQIIRMSTALAMLADVSLILLGGSLKRRERISARLGDILSQLYLASAVLKYYQDQGEAKDQVDYVCWCLRSCLYQSQNAINELLSNFPKKWVGRLCRFIVFPYGSSYSAPSDKLHSRIIAPMLEPSNVRDSITKNAYLSAEPSELGCRLDQALLQVAAIDPLRKKVHLAVQEGKLSKQLDFAGRVEQAIALAIISAEEGQQLLSFEQLRQEIIKVNEFSFDLSKVIA